MCLEEDLAEGQENKKESLTEEEIKAEEKAEKNFVEDEEWESWARDSVGKLSPDERKAAQAAEQDLLKALKEHHEKTDPNTGAKEAEANIESVEATEDGIRIKVKVQNFEGKQYTMNIRKPEEPKPEYPKWKPEYPNLDSCEEEDCENCHACDDECPEDDTVDRTSEKKETKEKETPRGWCRLEECACNIVQCPMNDKCHGLCVPESCPKPMITFAAKGTPERIEPTKEEITVLPVGVTIPKGSTKADIERIAKEADRISQEIDDNTAAWGEDWHFKLSLIKSWLRIWTSTVVVIVAFTGDEDLMWMVRTLALGYGIAELIGVAEEYVIKLTKRRANKEKEIKMTGKK